jgi:hypothetical protein
MGTSGMISRVHLLKESKESVQKWVRNNCLKFCSHNSPKKLQCGGCANNSENGNKLFYNVWKERVSQFRSCKLRLVIPGPPRFPDGHVELCVEFVNFIVFGLVAVIANPFLAYFLALLPPNAEQSTQKQMTLHEMVKKKLAKTSCCSPTSQSTPVSDSICYWIWILCETDTTTFKLVYSPTPNLLCELGGNEKGVGVNNYNFCQFEVVYSCEELVQLAFISVKLTYVSTSNGCDVTNEWELLVCLWHITYISLRTGYSWGW